MADKPFLQGIFDPYAAEPAPLPGQQAVKPATPMPTQDRYEPVSPAEVKKAAPATTPAPRRAGPTAADVISRATDLGVDPDFALSIWQQESASGRNARTSSKGARGGFQVMPGTFRAMMGDANQDDPWNNMEAGLRYIAYGQKTLKTNDPELLAAGYHAGYDRKDLKAGKIPGTSDGHITTAQYAREVAGRAGKVVSDSPADMSRYEPLSNEDAARFEKYGTLDDRYIPIPDDEAIKLNLMPAPGTETVANPFEPPKAPEARGFVEEYITDPLKRGWASLKQGLHAGGAMADARQLEVMGRIDRGEKVPDQEDMVGYQYMNPQQRAEYKAMFANAMKGATQKVGELGKEIQAIPQDPNVAAAQQAKTFDEWWAHFKKAPFKFIANTGVESLPQMAPGLVLGAGAGVAANVGLKAGGAVAGAAGMGAGSYAVDYPATVLSVLAEKGVNTNDPDALAKAFSDSKLMEDVRKQAHAHASVVGAADALSGGVAGKTLVAGKTAGRRVANLGAQTVAQGALGAGGEAGGQLAQGKDSIDVGAVMGEFAGEFAGAPIEVAGAAKLQAQEAAAARRAAAATPAADPAATTPQQQSEPQSPGAPLALPAPVIEVGPNGEATTASQRNAIRNAENSSIEGERRRQYEYGNDGTITPYVPGDGAMVLDGYIQPATPKSRRGPLSGAVDAVVEQAAAPRVTVTAPTGEQASGTVLDGVEDADGNFVTTIQGDDGQVYTFNSADGVVIAPAEQAPAGPLTAAVDAAAEQGAVARATAEAVEEVTPPPAPQPIEQQLATMDEPALRERLKYIASQAKASGGWNPMFMKARKAVEKEIALRQAGTPPVAVETPAEVQNDPVRPATDGQADVQPVAAAEADNAPRSEAPATLVEQGGPVAAGGADAGAGAGAVRAGDTADAQPALKDAHAGKWFSSREKAEAYVAKKKVGDTHEVVQTGKVRFEVKPKAAPAPEAVTAQGKAEASADRFHDEVTTAYDGQTNHTLTLRDDTGKVVGTVEYTVYGGKPAISMIDVPATQRRKGYGADLVTELQRRFPDQEIEWGGMTDEGSALRKALEFREEPTEHASKFDRLEKARAERDALMKKAEEFQAIDAPTEEQREEYYAQIAPMNDLHDEIDDLERELYGERPSKKLIVGKKKAAEKVPEVAPGDEPAAEAAPQKMAASEKRKPEPKDASAAEATAPAAPIGDFGEKIHGARKDVWAGFREDMSAELPENVKDITLAKHFPEPNYEALIAAGVEPKVLAAFKAMRDEIPAKPRMPYKARRWGEQVTVLRDYANKLLDGSMSVDGLLREMRGAGASSLRDFADRIEMYVGLGYPLFRQAKDYKLEKHHYTMFRGETPPGGITKWELSGAKMRSDYFDTQEQGIEALRARLEAQAGQQQEGGGKAVQLDLYRVTATGDIVIGKKIAAGKFIDLKPGFKDVKSARAYLAEHRDELVELLEKKKDVRPERRGVNEPRVGVDRRKGEDITPEQFGETFGFRGVQFGNYVEQKRRAADLNNAYDALLDMAEIIGVPPKAISLNGTLGLAFGARGKGGKNPAAAHYEPGHVVINLTKTNGAGSLGHEWWHGLDNYYARMRGAGGEFVTQSPKQRMVPNADRKMMPDESIRPEVLDAFKGVVDAIRDSGMLKRSRELDKRRTKDYWSTIEELTARAFESYLIDKAAEKGQSNDYLANIVSEDAHNATNGLAGMDEPFPYPTRAEAPEINAAFDRLFETLETREEDGKVALFSVRGDDDARPVATQTIPDAIVGGVLGDLSKQPDYAAAKAGDVAAAVRVTKDVVTPDLIERVRALVGDSDAIIQPIAAIEAAGRNRIPTVAAERLAEALGLTAGRDIVQSSSPKRTGMDGLDRLFSRPVFDGKVEPGRSYVLLDDTITQGGTFAALARHIEAGGGRVLGVVALTGKQYSAKIGLSDSTLSKVRELYGDIEHHFQAAAGHGFDALTESEGRYLSNFRPVDAIRNRIVARGQQAGSGGSARADQGGKPEGLDPSYSVNDGIPQAEFGPVHTEYRNDPAGAIARLMADKAGEAIVSVPGLGDVSLIYGDEKTGLGHIARRRGAEFMQRLPELLRDGTIYSKPNQKDRVFVGNDRDEAVVRFEWDGRAKTWLLSAYEKHPDVTPAAGVRQSNRSDVVAERSGDWMDKRKLRRALRQGPVGAVIDAMIEAGVVVLHNSPKTLPKGLGKKVAGVQAVTMPDGTIHMVASNLSADNARAVLLHEAFHRGGEGFVGTKNWSELMGRLGSLYRQAGQSSGRAREFFDRARERVAKAKAKGAVATRMEVEEFAAYAIEEYETNRDGMPAAIRKWVEDLIGMVKAWVLKKYGRQLGAVTPAQLAAIAKFAVLDVAAARRGEIFGQVGEWFSIAGNSPELEAFTTEMEAKYPGLRFDLLEKRNGDLHLSRIVVPMDARERGTGTKFMEDLTAFADAQGKRIVLTASGDFGGSAPRLTKFYKRFGFVENKGKNKDFSTMEGMYREPQGEPRFSVTDYTRTTTTATPPEPPRYTPPEQGMLRKVQAAIQDGQNRVKQVQEKILEVTGRTSLGKSDAYGAETNRPGRIAARLEDFRDKMTEPLMERLAKSGYTAEQLSELLHAQHAEERNAAVARINPDMPDGGSGMTNDQAQAILTNYAGATELHELAKEARKIARATLDLKLAYGLIKAEDHELLATMYENYVPLKGDGEYGPKIKRAMGHEERDEHILENISRDYEQAVVVGEKNLARQSLLRMVLQFPDDDLWTARVPPRGRYVAGRSFSIERNGKSEAVFTSQAQVAAFLEAKGAEASQYTVLDSAGERVVEFVKPLQDNEVMVYVKGDPVRIQIKDQVLAQQLRPLDQVRMNPILEFMRGTNRWLSKVYTGYNPAFILRNTARDAMTGTINMLGNQGAAVTAKAWSKYPAAIKTMAQWARTKRVPDTKMGRYLTEYRMHGGKVGASYMSDLEQQADTLQEMYDKARGLAATARTGSVKRTGKVAWSKTVGRLAHVVEIANQATENALRLSLFVALREEGRSPGVAAQAAKSVTVDFDRKGTQTGMLGAIYLFFNPAIQGVSNGFKTLAKGEHRTQAWAALGMLGMAGAWAASAGMGDDPDRWLGEEWDSRTKNFIVNVGDRQIKIPLSQEFAPAYALGVALAEAAHGEDKMKTAVRIVSSFIDAYFPLQGAFKPDSDRPAADLALAATPTMLRPVTETALNRNTFGSQVVPETELTKDRPDNMKMYRGTKGTAYDAAAQGIAWVGVESGYAGRYENDITKVSPETIKSLWKTYTGGLGTFITDSMGVGAMAVTAPGEVELTETPIVKDFVKAKDVKAIRGRYYELSKEARKAITEFELAKKAGDGEALEDILSDEGKAKLVGLGRLVRNVNEAAAALGDEKVSINSDDKLSLVEKRARLKEIEKEEEALYRDAIDAFK